MNNGNNKDITSGITGIVAIVLFITGVAFKQLPIEIIRPKGAEMKLLEGISLQNVEARLWQDPFSAVKNYMESKSKDNPEGIKNHQDQIHTLQNLQEDIKKHLENDKTVTVLGVMVKAGSYAEDTEQRRRTRYAVLAGLNNQRYIPADSEHIGYVLMDKSNDNLSELPEIIPFEWLQGDRQDKKTRNHRILIIWIAEEYFFQKNLLPVTPSGKENLWTRAIVSNTYPQTLTLSPLAEREGTEGPYDKLSSLFKSLKYPQCKVKVLGPSNPAVLRRIDDNITAGDDEDIEFYSARITVSPKFLKLKNIKNKLFLTMHSDSRVADTLIDELNKRNIKIQKDKILLLSEWDTFYGQKWLKTIQQSIKKKLLAETPLLLFLSKWATFYASYGLHQVKTIQHDIKYLEYLVNNNLRHYTYLRGLDGDIPALKNEDSKQDKQKNQTADDQKLSQERPEGTSQFDYIRRLADEIAAENENNTDNKVKAIGLLGSDVHDKLILLQALRPKLPGMVFFTTNLDARLIPRGSYKWGQNLIVASSFGLELNKIFQRGIPPFRDVYQTSTFLATQLAVCGDTKTDIKKVEKVRETKYNLLDKWHDEEVREAKHKLLDKWHEEEPPRLFEIGRTEPFNITKRVGEQKSEHKQVCSLVKKEKLSQDIVIPKLNPPVPSLFPTKHVVVIVGIMSILVLFMILVTLRNNPVDTTKSMIHSFKVSLKPILSISIFRLLISLYFLILLCYAAYRLIIDDISIYQIYEPFVWFQGISVWPTEIIRFLTVILSFCFLRYSWKIIEKNQVDLGKNYFNYGKTGFDRRLGHRDQPIQSDGRRPLFRFSHRLHSRGRNDVHGCNTILPKTKPIFLKTINNIFYLKKPGDKNLPRRAKKLFVHYLYKSKLDYRLIRTVIFFLLFIIFISPFFIKFFPMPDPPARGQTTFVINEILLLASISPFWFLLFFITDALRCSERFLRDLTSYTTKWPSDVINRYTQQDGNTQQERPSAQAVDGAKEGAGRNDDQGHKKDPIFTDNELVNDWLEVKVAAIHTESILKLIKYPFIIQILLMFALNHLFDNWPFNWSLVIVMTFAVIILILHAWRLQQAAEKLRSNACDNLYKKLIRVKGHKNFEAIADQLELLIKQIENLRQGAFQSFLQRPLVKSILALLGSWGGLQILYYFY